MIEAELPDGTILEFPDDIDPQVMERSIKKYMKVPVGAPTDTPAPPPSLSMLDVGQQARGKESNRGQTLVDKLYKIFQSLLCKLEKTLLRLLWNQ